jgi:hypothetical protein
MNGRSISAMTTATIVLIALAVMLVAEVTFALWRTVRSGGGPAEGPTGTPSTGLRHVESDWASSGSLPSRPYRTVPRLP